MNLYEDQFSEEHDFPKVDTATKTLIIASTGRCGSHMLGHALHQTKSFGFPLEYANSANLAEWKRRLGIEDFQTVMNEIQRRRTSPNGVFGIKIHYPHIKQFGGFDNLIKMCPNAYFILLSRQDVLKQAVSLSIADQTGVWIAGQKPTNENPQYNYHEIDHWLKETILNNSSWRYMLAANGCNYIEMNFDQVKSNLVQSLERIADFVGVDVTSKDIPQEQVTKKQSNDLNKEWTQRFIAESNGRNELLQNVTPSFIGRVKSKVRRVVGG